ncbi:MAG: histidinol-phosphate transaminase [Alphaproteobacteria bacterium]|nr:histidinol-phosphate transaminase [Alphaproteobacteria bacterium]
MKPEIKNLLRPHYLTMDGYISAGMEVTKDDSTIFLNANENPFELPGLEGFNRYPQPQPEALALAFANAYGVDHDQIIMTRGADEALVILTKLFCEPHKDAVLICPPTFGMYGVDARAAPADVLEVPLLKEDGTFKLDQQNIIETASKPEVKLVYICTPNNPSGTSFDHIDVLGIAAALEGKAIVIVDETYAEFSAQGSICEDLDSAPNIIVLRTLSKSYSFAGMRMGCFISSDKEFISLVKAKALDAYPLPLMSIQAAFHVLSPEIRAIAKDNIKKLLNERDRVIEAFNASDAASYVFPTDANFFLVEMNDAKGFLNHCAKSKVILRDFSTKPLTENCLRISIGTPQENDLLLDLLADYES